MENNSPKSNHLPWPLLIVMGIGGTIIASLLTSMVALAVRGNVFVYGVLSIVAIAFAIVIARDDGSDNKDVQSLLVAYPLFIVGFAFGYIAGDHHMTLTLVLQFVAALLSFALSKIHLCRQMLLCYASVVLPLISFSYFDLLRFGRAMKDGNIEMSCFAIIIVYMGVFAATIKDKWLASTVVKDCLKTIRFATAVVSVALLWFIHRDNTAFAIAFAAISFVIASVLLRKYVTGKRLIEGYILALLCCASTAMYPTMAMPITGMLLSFLILDYVCLVIFSAAFICGISFFYYDLEMLLINKSYLLMASGALFLLAFYYIKRVTK
jgi:hypothetical protein